jgi:hypothetical protein
MITTNIRMDRVPILTVQAYSDFLRALFVRVASSPVEAAYALYLLDRGIKASQSAMAPPLTRRAWARSARRPSILPHDHEWPYYGKFDGDEPVVRDIVAIAPIAEEKEASNPTTTIIKDEEEKQSNNIVSPPLRQRPISAPLTRQDTTKRMSSGRTGARLVASTSSNTTRPTRPSTAHIRAASTTQLAKAAVAASRGGRVLATRTHSLNDQQFQPLQHLWSQNDSSQVPVFMRHFLANQPQPQQAATTIAASPTVTTPRHNNGGTGGSGTSSPRPQSAGSRSGTPQPTPRSVPIPTPFPPAAPAATPIVQPGMVVHASATTPLPRGPPLQPVSYTPTLATFYQSYPPDDATPNGSPRVNSGSNTIDLTGQSLANSDVDNNDGEPIQTVPTMTRRQQHRQLLHAQQPIRVSAAEHDAAAAVASSASSVLPSSSSSVPSNGSMTNGIAPAFSDSFGSLRAGRPPRGPGLFTKKGHRLHLQRELRHIHSQMQAINAQDALIDAHESGEVITEEMQAQLVAAQQQSVIRRGPVPTRRPGAKAPTITVTLVNNSNGDSVEDAASSTALVTYAGSSVHNDLDSMWHQISQLHVNDQHALLTHDVVQPPQPIRSTNAIPNSTIPHRARPLSARGTGNNEKPLVTPRSRPLSARSPRDGGTGGGGIVTTYHGDGGDGDYELTRRMNAAVGPRDHSLSTALFATAFAPTSKEALAIERALIHQYENDQKILAASEAATVVPPGSADRPLSLLPPYSVSSATGTSNNSNDGRTSYSLQTGAFITSIDSQHIEKDRMDHEPQTKLDEPIPSSDKDADTTRSAIVPSPIPDPSSSSASDIKQSSVDSSTAPNIVLRPQSAPIVRSLALVPTPPTAPPAMTTSTSGDEDSMTRLESMWMQICLRYPPDGVHHPSKPSSRLSRMQRPSSGVSARPRSARRQEQLSLQHTQAHQSRDWRPEWFSTTTDGQKAPMGAARLVLQPTPPPGTGVTELQNDNNDMTTVIDVMPSNQSTNEALIAVALSLPPALLALMPPLPTTISTTVDSTSAMQAETASSPEGVDTTINDIGVATTSMTPSSNDTSQTMSTNELSKPTSSSRPSSTTQSHRQSLSNNSGRRSGSPNIHPRSVASSSSPVPSPPGVNRTIGTLSIARRPNSARLRQGHETPPLGSSSGGIRPSSATNKNNGIDRSPNPRRGSGKQQQHRASFSFDQAASFAARQQAADAAALAAAKPPRHDTTDAIVTLPASDSSSAMSTSSSAYLASLPASSAALLQSITGSSTGDITPSIDALLKPSTSDDTSLVGTTLTDTSSTTITGLPSVVVGSAAIVTIRDEDENSSGDKEGDELDKYDDENVNDDNDDDEAILSAVQMARRDQHDREIYRAQPLPVASASQTRDGSSPPPLSFTSSPMSLWARPPSAPSTHPAHPHHHHSASLGSPIPSSSSTVTPTSLPISVSSRPTSARPRPPSSPAIVASTASSLSSASTSASSSSKGGSGMSSDYYAGFAHPSSPIPTPPLAARLPSSPNLFARTKWGSSRKLNSEATQSSSATSSSSSTLSSSTSNSSGPPVVARLPSFAAILSARNNPTAGAAATNSSSSSSTTTTSATSTTSSSTSSSSHHYSSSSNSGPGSFAYLMASMMKEDNEKREREAVEELERQQQIIEADEQMRRKKKESSKKKRHMSRSTSDASNGGTGRHSRRSSSTQPLSRSGHHVSVSISGGMTAVAGGGGGGGGSGSSTPVTPGSASRSSSRPSSGVRRPRSRPPSGGPTRS